MANDNQEEQETFLPQQGRTEPAEEASEQKVTQGDPALPQEETEKPPSGETQKPPEEESGTEQPPSRAEERVKEVLGERDAAQEERDYWQRVAAGEEGNPYEAEQSSSPKEQMSESEVAARKVMGEYEMKQQMDQAEKEHPELKDDDLFASAVVGAYQAQRGRKTLTEVASDLKKRTAQVGERKALAETAGKMAGQAGKARPSKKGSGGWTREEIANMSDSDYARHHREIFDAAAKGEIKGSVPPY